MQIHIPGGSVAEGEFTVSLRQASSPFAVITLDPQSRTRLFMQTRADCERLMAAAAKAKLLLQMPGETGEPVAAGAGREFSARTVARETLEELKEAENDGLYADADDRVERDPHYWVGRLIVALKNLLEATEPATAADQPAAGRSL